MSSMEVEEEAKGLVASKLLKDLHLGLKKRDAKNLSATLETMARTGDMQHLLELGLLKLLQSHNIVSLPEFENIEASLSALMEAIEKKYPGGVPGEITASGEKLLSVVLADSQFLLTTAKGELSHRVRNMAEALLETARSHSCPHCGDEMVALKADIPQKFVNETGNFDYSDKIMTPCLDGDPTRWGNKPG